MIETISRCKLLPALLLKVYDSANWLYNDARWAGKIETFVELASENSIILAHYESEVVGFLSYKRGNGFVVLTGLYVIKHYQQKGVASLLLSNFKSTLSQAVIYAEVMDNAKWAIDFYQKHDFNKYDTDLICSDKTKGFLYKMPGTSLFECNVT